MDALQPDAASPRCDLRKPFAISLLANVNTGDPEYNARLTADQQTMYFSRGAPGENSGNDIFVATRTLKDAPFTDARPVNQIGPNIDAVNSSSDEFGPSISADGNTLYFSSNRPITAGDTDYNLYVATRTNPAGSFSAGPIASLNAAGSEYDPYITPDGTAIYWFVGGAMPVPYVATRGAGGFSTPKEVPGLTSSGATQQFIVSDDQRTAYFASDRPGSKAGYNIWTATRATPEDAFTNIQALDDLNTDDYDAPSWVSGDGCTLYFHSTRTGASDLYVAQRPE